ncbi:MAG: hypothetical protein IJ282_09815 [Lachnospiraceae bacterium]|nr:hypothetical protein [Lachnospiraceae bacterium]
MADIKNYLKGKRERQEISYTEKIHRHRLSSVYRFALLAVAALVVGIIFWVQYQNQIYEGYDVLSGQKKEGVYGVTEMRLAKGLLTYSKDGAHYTNSDGEVQWNQTYQMQSPIVATCEDVTAFADYNGRKIYVYDTATKLGEIDTILPIRSLCVAANGVTAAVLDDGDVTWIRTFSATGTVLVDFKTSMKDYGYPVSVSLSPNGILCAVSYLYMDMGEMKSSVAFYNFGEVGKNQVDNLVGGYNHADTIVPFVQFMNANTAIAVGDDRLVFYSGNQKPENVANILFSDELQAVYYNEEYVGLVFLNSGGNGKRLDIYGTDGVKKASHEFNMEHTDILFDKNVYIIYNETELYIGTIDGREKYNGTFTEPINLLVPTGKDYCYMIVTQDAVEVIKLR